MKKASILILSIISLLFGATFSASALEVSDLVSAQNYAVSLTTVDILGIVFAAIAVIAAIVLFTMAQKNKSSHRDVLTGLGSKKQMRNVYENEIDVVYIKHYYIIYIAFDAVDVETHFGIEKSEDFQKFIAQTINRSTGNYDFAARIENGVFLICMRNPDASKFMTSVDAIVNSVNNYASEIFGEEYSGVRAGIYPLANGTVKFDVAVKYAQYGYKSACANCVASNVCTKELIVKEEARGRLREKLSRAIDNNEFEPFLQFVYDVGDKKFIGAEILSRWNDPIDGFKMPGYYIADMFETGIIAKFDYYMLEKTCQILAKWKKEGRDDLKLSFNVTRVTISSKDFLQKIYGIIKKYDFNYDKLIFEITEDALVDNHTVAYKNIVDCKQAGFKIAIDDFGSGSASFCDLCDYPVDIIKVDRQIVTKLVTDRGDAVLRGLAQMAHDLHMSVLCEGVEQKEQKDVIIKNNCDYIQGYYFSYVFPYDEGMDYLKKSPETLRAL